MSKYTDLSAVVNATHRAKSHVVETPNIKKVGPIDAVLNFCNVTGDTVAFEFEHDSITVFASKDGQFYSATIHSPVKENCSWVTAYTAEQAARGLLSHLGATIFMGTKICMREKRAGDMKALTAIASKGEVESAPHFSNVMDFLSYVESEYEELSWEMPEHQTEPRYV